MDISNILDTSWNTIYNYFIDTQINIKDDDDYKTKFEKFLLKYKRILGLVLLILLLIIGYYGYYDGNDGNSRSKNDNKNIIQKGGDEPMFANSQEAKAHLNKQKVSSNSMDTAKKEMAKEQAAADAVKSKARSKMSREAHKAEAVTVRKEKKAEKKATQKADAMKTKDSVNKSVAAFRAKGYKGHLKSSAKGLYNVGAAGAESIRENADWFYGVLYAIALSLVICIITIPSIAFFIVGIICYFLLKNNMKSIKGF